MRTFRRTLGAWSQYSSSLTSPRLVSKTTASDMKSLSTWSLLFLFPITMRAVIQLVSSASVAGKSQRC